MGIKYIVDTKGKPTEVVVPIQVWERLTKKSGNKSMTKSKLHSYIGKIKLSVNPLIFQKSVRNEW